MPLVEINTTVLEQTATRLHHRVRDRFPGSGLEQRSLDLIQILRHIHNRADEISKPIWWIRLLYVALAAVVIAALVFLPKDLSTGELDAVDWVQFVESAVNDLIFLGAGLLFVTTVETRIKRRRALRELHEIRSFAHVIDMMQLTKDPQRLAHPGQATEASPVNTMTAYELGRYLDYCSEMLSMSAKGAAVIAQRFDDPTVLAAVNEIETLTSGLSRKIWQKLMVLMSTDPEAAPTSRA
jgi:hypothetical protein